MSVIAPRLLVDGPALTPRPYSLLQAATILDLSDVHAGNGLTWQTPTVCDPADVLDVRCGTERPYTKDDVKKWAGPDVAAEPFIVYAYAGCSAIGSVSPEQAEEQARRNLAAGEAYAVERAVMTGEAGNGTSFQGATDLSPTGADTLNPVGALATLEAHLAENYLGVGVIHVPPAMVPYLCRYNLLERDGQRWRTCVGTRVAIGAGYAANVGPDGTAAPAGEAWLYATGAVAIYRSEVFSSNSFDLKTNDADAVAERVYAVGWDCTDAAVRSTLDC